MIEALGKVVGLDGGSVWVETERQSSCGSCSAKGCGTGALARVIGARSQRVKVANGLGAREGDTVVIGIPEDALVRGSLAVYIVPLLAMLAGALLGEALAPQWPVAEGEALTLLGAIGGFLFGLAWLRGFGQRAAGAARYQAVALRIEHRGGVAAFPLDHLRPTRGGNENNSDKDVTK